MKILHVATYLSQEGAYGGPVSVAIEQMRELARLGHEVHFVVGWDGRAGLSIPGVHVHLFRARGIRRLRFSGLLAPGLLAFVAAHGRSFDVAHIHLGRDLITGVAARSLLLLGTPVVTQTHGMINADSRVQARIFDLLLTRFILAKAAIRLVLTPDESRSVSSLAGELENTVIRNAIQRDTSRMAKTLAERPIVLFLARLHPRKRVMAFAEMAKILHERGIRVDYQVIGPDEGDLPLLERFILEHPKVGLRYDGPAEPGSSSEHFAHADIYVLPSVGEVYPMTVIESVASKTPVVMTDDSGIAQDIRSTGAGLVTGASPSDLARGVERILFEPELRSSIERGQESAMRNLFDINVVARKLEKLYEEAQVGHQASSAQTRKRLLWMTNTAAPYRHPVWAEISKKVNLEVLLLENSRRLQKDGSNRGSDWTTEGMSASFAVREVPTWALRRGEARHYVPLSLNIVKIARADGILLGGWDSPAYLCALLTAKAFRTKSIGFYESHVGSHQYNGGIIGLVRRTYFRLLDEIVVPGEAARRAVEAMGVASDRVQTGFNAVDGVWLHEETNRLRALLPKEIEKTTRFLAVSQLIDRKNLKSSITSLAKLDDQRATLEVVGVGPQLAALRALCEELGVSHRVRFTGQVAYATLPDVFARSDVLIHVPTEEVWGLVVNEALAGGLAVIVSEECGVAVSVKGMEGVTLTKSDVESVSTAMNSVAPRTKGPIEEPEILRHSPEAFARVFLAALNKEPRSTRLDSSWKRSK